MERKRREKKRKIPLKNKECKSYRNQKNYHACKEVFEDKYVDDILVKGIITVVNTVDAAVAINKTNKKVTFKKCALFNDCKNEINNMLTATPMYNSIDYGDIYSKHLEVYSEVVEINLI